MNSSAPTLETIRFGEYLLERKAINDGEYLDALADHFANGGGVDAAPRSPGAAATVEALAAEYHGLHVVEVAASPALR